MASLPAPVIALAERQLGVVTHEDLLHLRVDGAYLTRGAVAGWVRRGLLEPLHRGVYRLPGTRRIPGQKLYAALRRSGLGARLGGPSALAFLDVEGFPLDGRDPPFVVVEPGRRLDVTFTWIAAPVAKVDAAVLAGKLPGVTPTRALIEAAGVVAAKRFRVAYDDLRRRRLVTQPRLVERAHDLAGVVPGADTVLDLTAGPSALHKESEGERRLSTIFLPIDPWPLWQVWVLPDVRVDAFYPEARLALEYYGAAHHTIDVDTARDRARAARLERELGIEVLVVRSQDLRDPAGLRTRILARRADRIRDGITPLRSFSLQR